MFRKGDKVRFLNETGEGRFVKLAKGGMAVVEVEDGFEYEYPLAQLVPVKEHERTPSLPETPVQVAAVQAETQPMPVNNRFPEGIFLVFDPKNQQFPSAGNIDVYVLNSTSYQIFFTLSLKDGRQWICIQTGVLGPGRKAQVDTLTPSDIDEWGQVKADILFYSDEPYVHLAPQSLSLKLKGVKFMKDSSYQEHLLVNRKCYVSEIVLIEGLEEEDNEKPFISNEDLKRMMELKEKISTAKKVSVPHMKNQVLEKEVDLHIEELLDNWNGMSNAQLLDIQLRHMQKELDAAIAAHMRKIVFIHGVGNGRLKQEVRKVLAGYKGIRFHDGSYQRYGFGATEVEII